MERVGSRGAARPASGPGSAGRLIFCGRVTKRVKGFGTLADSPDQPWRIADRSERSRKAARHVPATIGLVADKRSGPKKAVIMRQVVIENPIINSPVPSVPSGGKGRR